jgi:hypothetical protein
MMIYPWEWLLFFVRRFATLLVSVVKPRLDREYLDYTPSKKLANMLRGKFITDSYQNAINRVTFYKEKLVILFINSHWQDHLQIKGLVEQLVVDNTKEDKSTEEEPLLGESSLTESPKEQDDKRVNYYAIEVNDYYGWLLACKMGVYRVPSTLIIGPGPSGPRLFERFINTLPRVNFSDAPVNKTLDSRRPILKTPSPITEEIQREKTLIEQQEEAYQRSLQTDLLRRRIVEKQEERSKVYERLLDEWVVPSGSEEVWFKLAIILPDGQRVSSSVKKDAPLQVLFAIVRDFETADFEEGQKLLIKSVNPLITFKEGDPYNSSLLLKDSGIYQLQKMYVEID